MTICLYVYHSDFQKYLSLWTSKCNQYSGNNTKVMTTVMYMYLYVINIFVFIYRVFAYNLTCIQITYSEHIFGVVYRFLHIQIILKLESENCIEKTGAHYSRTSNSIC